MLRRAISGLIYAHRRDDPLKLCNVVCGVAYHTWHDLVRRPRRMRILCELTATDRALSIWDTRATLPFRLPRSFSGRLATQRNRRL